jgi:hypothetical protein
LSCPAVSLFNATLINFLNCLPASFSIEVNNSSAPYSWRNPLTFSAEIN